MCPVGAVKLLGNPLKEYPLMQRLWNATEIEYRDCGGLDRTVRIDLWSDLGGLRAVIVLRDLPQQATGWQLSARNQARAALQALSHTYLPYLLRPEAQVLVLALHPRVSEQVKARALVLPLSA